MALPIPIPPHGTPFIDPKTGQVHLLWQNYLLALEQSVVINAAPIDARYWLSMTNAQLPNETNIGLLSSGYLKITTAIGVATPSTVAGVPVADLSGILGVDQGGTGANLGATGGTSQIVRQSTVGGTFTVGQLASTDISGVTASTYTPTLTGVANVAASTAYLTTYLRVGNTVIVGGKVDIDPTLAATATQLGITLPVAATFSTDDDLGGTACAPITGYAGAVYADAANNRAELQFLNGADVVQRAWWFQFVYRIV